MLIDLAAQPLVGLVHGVVHAGAHKAQEADVYERLGCDPVVWIEANPRLAAELRDRFQHDPRHRVLEACLGATTGDKVTFHVAESVNGDNQGQSSSVLELGTHARAHPEVGYVDHIEMTTHALDDCQAFTTGCNMLVADLQGYELAMLHGAQRFLTSCDVLYLEVNVDELYAGCGTLDRLDPFLVDRGFECTQVLLAGCQQRDCADRGNRWVGWGDGIWQRAATPRLLAETRPDLWAGWYP